MLHNTGRASVPIAFKGKQDCAQFYGKYVSCKTHFIGNNPTDFIKVLIHVHWIRLKTFDIQFFVRLTLLFLNNCKFSEILHSSELFLSETNKEFLKLYAHMILKLHSTTTFLVL